MSSSGLSPERLDRMHDVLAGYVRRGEVPGLVSAVSRRGETYVDVVGAATHSGAPMRRDTIMRISSMTKPVTAVAALILAEECVIRLDEPVDRWLPELADRQVLVRPDAPLDETEPARRPVLVRDLLTFTLGYGMLLGPPGAYPIVDAAAELGLPTGPPRSMPMPGPDDYLRRLGRLPLVHQPGDRWLYHTGSTLLGALIGRASGQSFDSFLHERIFEPLRMVDTGFVVPDGKLSRLASCFAPDTREYDGVENSRWRTLPAFPDGGGDLVSTVDDYLRFAQMLLDLGRYPGGRLLARTTVEAMTTDQLSAAQKQRTGPGLFDNHGYGFGVSIVTRRDDLAMIPGRYGWDGGLGSCWSNDPHEGLIAVLLTQKMWDSPEPPPIRGDFFTAAYAAIDD
jgi:CubicO group peptidase (beta-lactamase class C family)